MIACVEKMRKMPTFPAQLEGKKTFSFKIIAIS